MRKNTAGQIVGSQVNSRADGTALTTGTVTVYVTGDGGTQAAGSVGSGACTHEGNGFYSYAPAQAETNYDHVAFTFVHATGVNATVQIYPSFPQTGDNFARLGAPAGASHAADAAAIKTETASIQTDTNDIQTRLPAALVSGRIDASVGAMAANVMTAAAAASDLTTELQSGLATAAALATVQADTDDIQTRLPAALVGGRIDSSVGAIAAAAITAASIAADAITDAKVAADVTIASVTGAVGSVTGAVGSVAGNVGGNVTGSVGSVATGGIAAASFAAAAIDAAAIATDAFGALELAAGAASEIATAVRTELATELGRVDVAVSSRLATAGYTAPDNTSIASILVDTAEIGAAGAGLTAVPWNAAWDAEVQSEAADALNAYDPPTSAEMDARTLPAAGYASAANLATVAGYLDTEIGAIKVVTDKVDTAVELDGAVYRFTANALEQAPTGGSAPTVGQIADAVWDEARADHVAAGSFGLASTDLDTQIAAVPTATENATQLLGTSVDGSTTVAQSLRLHNSALGAKASGMATATATFRDLADSKNRIVATVDADGNRSAVILDLAA